MQTMPNDRTASEITPERAEELATRIEKYRRAGIDEAPEIVAALRKLADLMRIVGPEMPCGCYAVQFARMGDFLYCGIHHIVDNPMKITPEYVAWEASR
jgi:hypothetical protein